MKKHIISVMVIFVCVILFCGTALGQTAKELKVLTIGASFWSAGGASFQVIKALLESQGYKAETESARGGPNAFHRMKIFQTGVGLETLKSGEVTDKSKKQAQVDVESCLKDLKAKDWDFVCFMAHSSEPFQGNALDKTDAYIEELKKNKPAKSKLVATMTWVKEPQKQDYETIRKYYKGIAEKYGILFAPSGDAFEIVEKDRPDIPIFRSDMEAFKTKNPGKTDRHPSIYGQYLNSCVVVATITGASPVGLPCKLDGIVDTFDDKEGDGLKSPMDIPPDIAKYLQETAWKVVQALKSAEEKK